VPEVSLSAGTIEYEDTGGTGPVVVLLHGVVMDGSLWRDVVAGLRADHRCVVPTLPLGAHRRPMNPDADLSLAAQARLVGEFLDKLDLRDVTLVNSDWGGSQVLVSEGRAERVGQLVLTSCEAFDNYPPGLPGKMLGLSAMAPGGLLVALGTLRVRPLRRLPMTWGHMSKRPVPDEMMDGWIAPALSSAEIRRDFKKYATTLPSKKTLLEWADRIRDFDRPGLVVWASEDRIMPPAHGRRLAEMLPQGRLVEIADSYTLIPIDQPTALVDQIRSFIKTPAR
jgi:pimeloyl-ACP methyl ester carboxylesterase